MTADRDLRVTREVTIHSATAPAPGKAAGTQAYVASIPDRIGTGGAIADAEGNWITIHGDAGESCP